MGNMQATLQPHHGPAEPGPELLTITPEMVAGELYSESSEARDRFGVRVSAIVIATLDLPSSSQFEIKRADGWRGASISTSQDYSFTFDALQTLADRLGTKTMDLGLESTYETYGGGSFDTSLRIYWPLPKGGGNTELGD